MIKPRPGLLWSSPATTGRRGRPRSLRWNGGARCRCRDRWRILKKTLSIINANIAYHERFLGKGKAAGKAWHYPARLIGERVLEVLQSAHEAAGHKTSVRYTDAILQFICEKLAPVCEQVGEESPALDTLRNELTRRRATDAP